MTTAEPGRRSMGTLVALEGPEGVGKTTLALRLTERLRAAGYPAIYSALPGREPGTLGAHVYRLHHQPASLGVAPYSQVARQLLHLAAHAEAATSYVGPQLAAGKSVVLDRWWWSLWVYGSIGGVPPRILERMVEVETALWEDVRPDVVLLLTSRSRRVPIAVQDEYAHLIAQVRGNQSVHNVCVDSPPEIDRAWSLIESIVGVPPVPHEKISPKGPVTQRADRIPLSRGVADIGPATATPVFDTFWKFAAERQEVFFRRQEDQDGPWTDDPILRRYRFTNAYRASDRTSQYLIRHVLYEGEQSADELVFRALLFKLFNRIETWSLLGKRLGDLTWRSFDIASYDEVLTDASSRGIRLYSGAYIMPSGRTHVRKHRHHLELLERMMRNDVPGQVTNSKSLQALFDALRSYPSIGNFLAYQYAIDLNYSGLVDFSENDFVVPGPGAASGLAKCFVSLGGLQGSEIMRLIVERQDEEFARRGLRFRTLWGRPLHLIDVQNLFCEVDKYSRLAHPNVQSASGRTRMKRGFEPNPSTIDYWFPPKWGLNDPIRRGRG